MRYELWWYFAADLYRLIGDSVNEAEGYRMHTSFSQSLLRDHFQSSQLSEHGLIQVSLIVPQRWGFILKFSEINLVNTLFDLWVCGHCKFIVSINYAFQSEKNARIF